MKQLILKKLFHNNNHKVVISNIKNNFRTKIKTEKNILLVFQKMPSLTKSINPYKIIINKLKAILKVRN